MVWIIIGLYLVFLLGITWFSLRMGSRGADDYFLAGRSQNWLVTGFTLMATFFSAFALMGAPGMLHQHGIAFIPFFLNPLVAGLLIWVIGNRIRSKSARHNWITPSDLICHFFPSQVMNVLVCLVGFFYVLPYIILQIKAGGYLFEVLTAGQVSAGQGAVILALVTMLYVHLGGMRSVAWTDLVQGILLLAGMVWSGWAAWRAVSDLGQGGF